MESQRTFQGRHVSSRADDADHLVTAGEIEGATAAMIVLVRCLARQAAREACERINADQRYPADTRDE